MKHQPFRLLYFKEMTQKLPGRYNQIDQISKSEFVNN